jgi:hypothetical protein
MRVEYISGSAGALVVGAIAITAGYAFNPLPQDDSLFTDPLLTSQNTLDRWLLCAWSLSVASIALTLGVAALLSVMDQRRKRLRVAAAIVFATGTIGLGGYAAMLLFLRALLVDRTLGVSDIRAVLADPSITVYFALLLGCLMLGIVLIGYGMWVGRGTPRWVPVTLWAFVASQFVPVPGNLFTVVQFAVFTVAATGAAVAANDRSTVRDGARPASSSGRR